MFDSVAERGACLRGARAAEGRISAVRAEQVRLLARYADLCAQEVPGPVGVVDGGDSGLAELSGWMTWTEYRSGRAVEEAVRLTSCLPATLAALASGRIDYPMAQVVVAGVRDLDDDAAAAVDEAVGPCLGSLTTAQLRARVELEVLGVDPAAVERRRVRGVRGRHVQCRPDGDGLATLSAVGPAVDVLAAREDLRRRARARRREPGETRTIANLEFDLLTAVSGATPATVEGGSTRTRPSPAALVQVTVALSTLAGWDDSPADLAGYGPVPAQVARDLATGENTRLRRLVTDPVTGALLGADGHTHPPLTEPVPRQRSTASASASAGRPQGAVVLGPGVTPAGAAVRPGVVEDPDAHDPDAHDPGRHDLGRHDPPVWMERFVRARDRCCTMPWCRQPATRCDLDHVIAYPAGPTCPCNLHPLCRRHHRTKQSARWQVRREHGGATVWRTPTGLMLTTPPAPVLPRPTVTVRPPPPPVPPSPVPPSPGLPSPGLPSPGPPSPRPPSPGPGTHEDEAEQALDRAAVQHRFGSRRRRALDEADRTDDRTDTQADQTLTRQLTAAGTRHWGPEHPPGAQAPPDEEIGPIDIVESTAWATELDVALAQLSADHAAETDHRTDAGNRDLQTLRAAVTDRETSRSTPPWWNSGSYAGPPPF